MRGKQTTGPYYSLGQELRVLRTKAKESLADTSGAVEIDVAQLANYESGRERPNEELLLMLISHFEPKDTDALKLWKLAGYSLKGVDVADELSQDDIAAFTDFMEVSVNPNGLILDFKQTGLNGQFKSIAKVGMSRQHAQNVIQALIVALSKTDPNNGRLLLPNKTNDDK